MKKLFALGISLLVVLVMVQCGSKTENANAEDYGTPDESGTPVAAADITAQGEALVNASDCKTCHHKENKLIGPSHTDVAKKYEFTQANVTLLASKIINGGTGVWGEIPMSAHPDLSQADAEKMARYILSIDGETEH